MSDDNVYMGQPSYETGSDYREEVYMSSSLNDGSESPPPAASPRSTFRASDLMRVIERYMDTEDANKVYQAFLMAADAHDNVFRKDKVTPYITHPLAVAHILAESHLDKDTLCAALLHDVLEDTDKYSEADIVAQFGEAVAEMVQGVTKLEKSETLATKQAVTVASFRKMMNAMTRDFRVALIKLADRLHNMQTLGNMSADARRRISEETFNIYIPLAEQMGMNESRRKLQALAFQNLNRWRSTILQKAFDRYQAEHEEQHRKIEQDVMDAMLPISGSAVFLWDKSLYGMYEHARREGTHFRKQCDLLEIRVVVKNREECYLALGIIHQLYRPRMGTFNDFIATPRSYGYQALQTTVMAPGRQQVKFQIQTRDMFNAAQYGITAQWRCPDMRSTKRMEYTQDVMKSWIAQVKELDYQADDPNEFYADLKAGMSRTEVYAYTPAGDRKEFPRGATLVDFAYAIHTQVGNHCYGARVDGVERPLRTRIPNNMAIIEILTDPAATPQPSWQNFVVTGRAQSSIRSWLRQKTVDELLTLGRDRLESVLAGRGSSIATLDAEQLANLCKVLGYADLDALFTAIGRGDECAKLLTERLLGNMPAGEGKVDTPLLIKGTIGLTVKFASCCLPLPRENILAHQQRHRGLEIHRADCPQIARLETSSANEIFAVAWAQDTQAQKFLAGVVVDVRDVKGMLSQITSCLNAMDVSITDLTITGDGNIKQDTLIIEVNDLEHLQEVIRQLKHIPNVLNVSRLTKKDSHGKDNHFHD